MNKTLLYFFFATITVLGSAWILQSNGFYFIDELSRFLYSRFVLQALPVTVETWHRPIPLWLFALPAQFGHTFTMFFALALYLVLLVFTYKVAVLKRIPHAEWVVLLTGLQPILFDVSYACMNEVPAALVLILSYWFHLKGRHAWSLAIASLAVMCRPETYIFAVLLFLVYLRKREWRILPLVVVGPVLWIALTTIISGSVTTFFAEWSKYSDMEKYLPGVSVFFYPAHVSNIFGIAQVFLFIAGGIFIARARRSAEYALPYAAIAGILLLNTLTGAEVFHWTGSVADLRYLTVVGPFVGIVSLVGLSELMDRIHAPSVRTAFSVCVFTVVVFNCTLTTHPRRWENYDKVVISMARSAQQQFPGMTLLSNSPVVQYVLDVPPSGGRQYAHFTEKMMAAHPECLILLDPYTEHSFFFRSNVTREQLRLDPRVVLVDHYTYGESDYTLLHRKELFPKRMAEMPR